MSLRKVVISDQTEEKSVRCKLTVELNLSIY